MGRNVDSIGPPAVDGRVQRGARNRAAIVDALLSLLEEGEVRPAARAIAERANVSVRSVFQHFAELEGLYAALIEAQQARILPLLPRIDPDDPYEQRVTTFVAGRATVYERITPVRRALLLAAPSSATLQDALADIEAIHARDVARTFGPELDEFDAAADTRAALTLVTSWEVWDRLRTTQRCSVARAQRILVQIIGGTLQQSRAH